MSLSWHTLRAERKIGVVNVSNWFSAQVCPPIEIDIFPIKDQHRQIKRKKVGKVAMRSIKMKVVDAAAVSN